MVINYGEGGGGGGATKREVCVCVGGGGASEVLPLQKGGTGNVLAILKGGGGQRVLGSFTQVLEVLTIHVLEWGTKGFHPLKGGPKKFYPVLRWGGGGEFRTLDFLILYSPSSPSLNGQSLRPPDVPSSG